MARNARQFAGVAAAGSAGMFKRDWIEPGANIDVGATSVVANAKKGLPDEVDFPAAVTVAGAITSVPGGGAMTITTPMHNTVSPSYGRAGRGVSAPWSGATPFFNRDDALVPKEFLAHDRIAQPPIETFGRGGGWDEKAYDSVGNGQSFAIRSNLKMARHRQASSCQPNYSAAVVGEVFFPPGFFAATFFAAADSAAFRPSPALKAKDERWAE
jgi:hypothetical protein